MSAHERENRPTPEPQKTPWTPLISVVLPVRNEEPFIAQTLAQLQSQDYPREALEMLVCDGRSDDRTREIVEEFSGRDPRIRLLDNPGRRSSSGRNVGIREARGEVIIIIDGHVRLPSKNVLRNFTDCFELSGADCLGRPAPPVAAENNAWVEAIIHARNSRLGHSPESFIYSDFEGFAPAASMGAAYRREVFDRVGHHDESFDACEDLEINTRIDRAGLRCYTSPRLAIEYYARDSPRALYRQQFRYGFGRYKYLRKHPACWSVGQLIPPLLAAGTLALPALAWLWPPLFWADLGGVSAYLLAVVLQALALAARTRAALLPRYLVVFPAIHFGLGIGFLASLLRGGRT